MGCWFPLCILIAQVREREILNRQGKKVDFRAVLSNRNIKQTTYVLTFSSGHLKKIDKLKLILLIYLIEPQIEKY